MRRALAIGLALGVVAASASSSARPSRRSRRVAEARFEAGVEHYQQKDYAAAVRALEESYRLDPRPEVTFALAQALRHAGECGRALILYREVLDRTAVRARRAAIESAMEPCLEAPAPGPGSSAAVPSARATTSEPPSPRDPAADPMVRPPEPAPPATGTPSMSDPTDDGQARRSAVTDHSAGGERWYSDALGTSLVVAGVVAMGGGGAALYLSSAAYDRADRARSETSFASEIERGDRLKLVGIVASIAGGALVAGGVVRWVVIGGDRSSSSVAVMPDPRGGLVVVGVLP